MNPIGQWLNTAHSPSAPPDAKVRLSRTIIMHSSGVVHVTGPCHHGGVASDTSLESRRPEIQWSTGLTRRRGGAKGPRTNPVSRSLHYFFSSSRLRVRNLNSSREQPPTFLRTNIAEFRVIREFGGDRGSDAGVLITYQSSASPQRPLARTELPGLRRSRGGRMSGSVSTGRGRQSCRCRGRRVPSE